jgi:hypothetical protein
MDENERHEPGEERAKLPYDAPKGSQQEARDAEDATAAEEATDRRES